MSEAEAEALKHWEAHCSSLPKIKGCFNFEKMNEAKAKHELTKNHEAKQMATKKDEAKELLQMAERLILLSKTMDGGKVMKSAGRPRLLLKLNRLNQ